MGRLPVDQLVLHDPTRNTYGDGKQFGKWYHMIYGMSNRGTNHAVVGVDGEVVHDPHPLRVGALPREIDVWWGYAFLVPAVLV